MNHVDLHPRILSLCSGIGGLDLGIRRVFPAARTVCYVEREAACIEILANRMEEGSLDPAPVWTDLKTFDGTAWRGAVDLIAAGYPCQPFSIAGKRRGADDPRHLWPGVKRIIGEVGPRAVVLENVQGHVRLGLSEVLKDLSELGYDAEWGVFSAAQAGAPHQRKRLFILAYANGELDQRWGERGVFSGTAEASQGEAHQRQRGGHTADDCREGIEFPILAYANGERLNGERVCVQQWRSQQGSSETAGSSKQLADSDSKGLQGWGRSIGPDADEWAAWPPGPEDDWSDVPEHLWPATQSNVCGVPDGLSNRVDRLRALGNAVVPQQAAHAIRGLLQRALKD